MDVFNWHYCFIIIVFALGYSAIILEHYIKVNKTAVALCVAVILWSLFFVSKHLFADQDLDHLGHHVSEISQIIFFLMGAMALVEVIDSHGGFKIITDYIHTNSRRKMLWMIAFIAFFLSSVLDNLTTTILMISLLRKLIPVKEERFFLGCIVVVAANAGGAWTPIGDVTTTMLWINNKLSTWSVIKVLFVPSLVSLLVPLVWYTRSFKGKFAKRSQEKKEDAPAPGARLVFWLGLGGLVFVPVFKALTGLPPFMGVLLALSVLWLVTDILHYKHQERSHLRVPHVLTRVDTSGVLFFLGILLCVAALQTAGILQELAVWLDSIVHSQAVLATLIGFMSAVIDNVPLVAATMGMYSAEAFPLDASLWHMIAYAAGTGGSMLIIGSAAGVAFMGMEKVDFVTYMKKATLPVAVGFLAGMGVYLLAS